MDFATDRDIRYRSSVRNSCSLIILTAFEPGLDVAFMGAVFPMSIAVGREGLPAAGAGKGIHCFLPDAVGMFPPPIHPAFLAAEHTGLHPFHLRQRLAAFPADTLQRLQFSGQAVPPAEALDCIFGNAELVCHRSISMTFSPKACNLTSLLFRHGRIPPCHTEISSAFWGPAKTKKCPPREKSLGGHD